MNARNSIGLLGLLFLTVSCSNPLDKEFDRETAEGDFARIVRMGKIDSTQAYVMSHFMVEHNLIGAQVLELDATYRDILEESTKYWEKTRAEREGRAKEDEGASGEQQGALTVNIQPVGDVQTSQWSHGMKYKVGLENTSGKPIRAIKGNFVFVDPFGDEVYKIEYKFLDKLDIAEKAEREVTLRLQNTASPQQVLEYGATNPFTVKWEVVSILF